jgi:hypothetical protein
MQWNSACPLYPRKRTYAVQEAISALGQKRTHAARQNGSLFDQLVGDREKIRRDIEAPGAAG